MTVPNSLYRKVCDTENPQGILAVARQRQGALEDVLKSGHSFPWVILDSLQDPGNVGTIVRTADAAGVSGIILTEGCADLYAGKTSRATMGSLFHIPVFKASVTQCLTFCAQRKIALYATGSDAAINYSDVNLTVPFAIVLGNEGSGVCEEFRRQALLNLKIPIVGRAESLNVSAAAAVLLFEATRQRGLIL
jgi:TrmH family RNA methyltransferase